jgi:AcrR family transcriptional regulator
VAETRAQQKIAVSMALRFAAVRLMAERGYEGTTTDDIARAAGVSPRTFFNYFPSKESVILMPEDMLSDLVGSALRARPTGEDIVASLSASAMQTITIVATLANPAGPDQQGPLTVAAVRLMFSEPALRGVFLNRRAATEDLVWTILVERGTAEEDLAARAAVSTVVSLTYLGLQLWAEGDARDPLPAVVARCLLTAPHPSRLATGVTAPTGR